MYPTATTTEILKSRLPTVVRETIRATARENATATRPASRPSPRPTDADTEAWARHASASNGFAEAVIG